VSAAARRHRWRLENRVQISSFDEGAQLVGTELKRLYNRPSRLRATTLDGRQLWDLQFAGPVVSHVAADNNGGVVLVFPDQFDDWNDHEYSPGTIRRLDGRTGAVTWEYVVERGAGSISEVAIHLDGTVYAFEEPYYGASVYLVGIDPSGAVQRWQLPHHTSAYRIASAPIVQEDGGVVLFSTEQWGDPEDKGSPRLITLRNGALQVDEVDAGGLDFQYTDPSDLRLMPDGSGGLLLAHRTQPSVCHISSSLMLTCRWLMSPFNGSYLSTDYVLADDSAYAVVQAVNNSGSTPHWAKSLAFDPVTLQETYAPAMLGPVRAEQPQLQMRFAIDGGGVYISGSSETYSVNAGPVMGIGTGGNVSLVEPGKSASWDGGAPSFGVTAIVLPLRRPKGDEQEANRYRSYKSNRTSIVLQTDDTPGAVFEDLVRTFVGVTGADVCEASAQLPISAVGQRITFDCHLELFGIGQWPFQVEVIRYDPAAQTIAVKTITPNHPLEGWRYWRVFQPEPGKLVMETGAVDRPAPWNPWKWILFQIDYWILGEQMAVWEQYMNVIQQYLLAPELSEPAACHHRQGVWNQVPKDYLLLNIFGPGTSRACQ
jgi:putative pyrroloquinoline-quinone binding quinoprotein